MEVLRDLSEDNADELDVAMLDDYMKASYEGIVDVPHSPSSNETLPKDTVGNAGPDWLLGKIVEQVVDVAAGKYDKPEFPVIPLSPLGFCVIGKPFSGKHTTASLLQSRFGLELVEVQQALDDAVNSIPSECRDNKKASPSNLTPQQALGMKVQAILAKGKPVPDEIMTAVIAEKIRRIEQRCRSERGSGVPPLCGGWVLVNFPQSVVQAAAFEKELSGFEMPKVPEKGIPNVSLRVSCAVKKLTTDCSRLVVEAQRKCSLAWRLRQLHNFRRLKWP